MRSTVLSSLSQTIELVFPRVCASCGAYGEPMTGSSALCSLCRRLLGLATVRPTLVGVERQDFPVFAAARYEHEVARCLLAFKNSGRTDLIKYVAPALVRSLQLALDQLDLSNADIAVVPLPSTRAATRRRGYAPAPELTRYSVHQLQGMGYPVYYLDALTPVSWLSRPTPWGRGRSQKALGRHDRFARMKGQLTVGSPRFGFLGRTYDLARLPCVLTDDVVTTGASMAEAKRALTEAGATVLSGATVAYVPKRKQD